MDSEHDDVSRRWVVSYKQLGGIILIFVLGIVIGMLVTNAQTGSPTAFTTTELIGFVLSVILSGSSIVLAITAIALGKYSEVSIMRRSDESIRLQNDVFQKTTDALQRIESSTGVTEKRIEDIISGRVGDISHQIAEMATGAGKYRTRDPRELEENIRKSLLSTLKNDESAPSDREQRKERKRKREEEHKKYQDAHEKFLYGIANLDGVELEKLGHGNVSESGDELFDGIYMKDGKRISVSTFIRDTPIAVLREFVGNAASEIANRRVHQSYIVIFKGEGEEDIEEQLRGYLSTLKEEIANRIHIVFSDYDQIEGTLKELAI